MSPGPLVNVFFRLMAANRHSWAISLLRSTPRGTARAVERSAALGAIAALGGGRGGADPVGGGSLSAGGGLNWMWGPPSSVGPPRTRRAKVRRGPAVGLR